MGHNKKKEHKESKADGEDRARDRKGHLPVQHSSFDKVRETVTWINPPLSLFTETWSILSLGL